MKQTLILSFVALAIVSACGVSQQTAQRRVAEQNKVTQTVRQKLDGRAYQIDINYMVPLRGGAKAVSNYSVSVDESTIDSHLPYVGEARSVPYGGGKGLTFKDKIESYTDSGWVKDKRTIVVKVKNEEDSYIYTLEVFDNGTASVRVSSRNRDEISYMGRLIME
ncbi:MAG: DUF4251 domain-containing protein [Bacteroidales bacterium]|nr:DUF4251 domain-containing protein [Bacteroidales bacterium]